MRDVYTNITRDDIPKLRKGLQYHVKTKPIIPVFILSIMEIEAWFLAEHTHFQRIHIRLTVDRIKEELYFDPSQDDMELREHPSQDLHQIYSLEGLAYRKREAHTKRTAEALNYANIYLGLRAKINPIEELCSKIDSFLDS
jgi:hypothetical protein